MIRSGHLEAQSKSFFIAAIDFLFAIFFFFLGILFFFSPASLLSYRGHILLHVNVAHFLCLNTECNVYKYKYINECYITNYLQDFIINTELK